jgi:hypothetical protein
MGGSCRGLLEGIIQHLLGETEVNHKQLLRTDDVQIKILSQVLPNMKQDESLLVFPHTAPLSVPHAHAGR